jgi:hypothetical protein
LVASGFVIGIYWLLDRDRAHFLVWCVSFCLFMTFGAIQAVSVRSYKNLVALVVITLVVVIATASLKSLLVPIVWLIPA